MNTIEQIKEKILNKFESKFPTKEQVTLQQNDFWNFTPHFRESFNKALEESYNKGYEEGLKENKV